MHVPTLPTVGDTLTLMGLTGEVTRIEPESDFYWHVEVTTPAGTLTLNVPTDQVTD